MVEIGPLAPLILQLSYCLFFAAALVQNTLLIRMLLSAAFMCLAVHLSVEAARTGVLSLDVLIWCICTGAIHWYWSYALARDQAEMSRERRSPRLRPVPATSMVLPVPKRPTPTKRDGEREPLQTSKAADTSINDAAPHLA